MLPIDNTLQPTTQAGFAFANGANRFTTLFATQANAASVTRIALDNSTMDFKPVGANAVSGQTKGSIITYPAAYAGADLQYQVLADELKESIVLSSPSAPTTYSFSLTLSNDLTYKVQSDGSIAFYHTGNSQPLYLIPKPFMYESGNESAASQQVTQTIRQDGGQFYLDITADPTWLTQAGRKFPVVIDPTVVVQPNPATSVDTFASSTEPTTAHNTLSYDIAGTQSTYGTTRSFLQFNLPGLPDGAHIDSAKFSLYMYLTVSDPTPTTVELHQVTSSWQSSTLTWNNQPTFATAASSSVASNTTGWWDFDATNLITGWYNGQQQNYGVMLLANPESANRRSFESGDYTGDPTLRPKMTINYTVDPTGDQSFWTYAGGVNPVNGNLMTTAVDLATPGRGIPAVAARAYNSRGASVAGIFGYGWSSNLDMHVTQGANGPVTFWDATGTKHVFQNNGDGTFTAPPGIHYTLTWDNPSSTYRITTLDNTVYTFNSSGYLTKITDSNNQTTTLNLNTSNQLTGITDPSGRNTTVAFNAAGFVSSVTDPAGRSATYSYDASNNLTSVVIQQGTSSTTVSYTYNSGHQMASMTDSKGQTTSVTYDTSNRVTGVSWIMGGTTYTNTYSYGTNASGQRTGTVAGPLGRSTTYTFNDTANLVQQDVNNGTTTLTTKYAWDTSNHLLSVTDPNNHTNSVNYNSNGQPVSGTDANQLNLSWNYDQNNNLITAKGQKGDVKPDTFDASNNHTEALDPLGNSSMMEYDSTGNLFSATQPISLADNLIVNPGFEDATLGNPTGWAVASGTGTATVDTSTKSGGYQSLKANSTTTSGLEVRTTNYIPVVPGANYNLTTDLLTASSSTAVLRVYWFQNATGTPSAVQAGTGDLSVTTGLQSWSRRGTQAVPPSDANYALVALAVSGTGTAWFDNVQFETGTGRWGNNTLANPSFDYAQNLNSTPVLPAYWNPSSQGTINIDFTTAHSGPASVEIAGMANTDVYVGQRVDLSGDSSTLLAFSGWARAVGGTAGVGTFAMQVYPKDSNGNNTETNPLQITFDPTSSNWQQATTVLHPTKPFAYLMVYADYQNQTGNAWFDDFELHKFNPPSAVVSTFNYAENGSMERSSNNTWPDGWQQSTQSGTTATFTWEGLSNAYAGQHAISISNPGGYASVTSTRQIPYDSTKTYSAVGYVKNQSTAPATLLITAYDSTGTWLGQVASKSVSAPATGTAGWTRFSVVLNSANAPANTASLRVGVQLQQGTGTADFDNIRLLIGEKRTTFGYDAAGNYVTSLTDPLGNKVTATLDANTGNTTAVSFPLGSAFNYTYDFLNRLTGTSYTYQSVNRTFTYGYDANGNLISVTDPNGKAQWTLSYNELNELSSSAQPVSGVTQTTTMTYDALGNLTKVASPNGTYKQSKYDNANRLSEVDYGTGTNAPSDTFTFGYDSASNLTSYSTPSGNTTLAYDNLNRLTDATEPSGAKIHSDYDAVSNRTGLSVTIPNVSSWSLTYGYDARSNTSQITDNNGKNTWYLYNEAGQLAKMYNQETSAGTSTFYDYDAAGHVTRVLVQNASGWATVLLRYAYDKNGNVTRVDDDLANKYVLYTYNELNELVKEEYWTNGNTVADSTSSYTYDELGNRTSVTKNGTTTNYTYNAEKNRLTTVGSANYSYDSNGNLQSDGTNTYTWDNANRLKQVQIGTSTYGYTYDALGRRVTKIVNGTITENYHYDGNRVAYVTNATGTILRRFTYDASGRPVYMGENGTIYYYHYNAHGDVIKLTDLSGASVADYQYDAWGNLTAKTGTLADDNPYRYAGYWYDAETGLYYLHARYYKPDIGRFISQDTYVGDQFRPLTHNLYSYVAGRPVGYVDPTGHMEMCGCFGDGGGEVGGGEVGPIGGGGGGFSGASEPAPAQPVSNAPASSEPASTSVGTESAQAGTAARAATPNPGKTTVYQSFDSSGKVQYVGITDDFPARASAHASQKGISISQIPGLENISRVDARAVEQVLIENYGLGRNGGQLLNKINSISPSNDIYEGAIDRGASLLRTLGYPGF